MFKEWDSYQLINTPITFTSWLSIIISIWQMGKEVERLSDLLTATERVFVTTLSLQQV